MHAKECCEYQVAAFNCAGSSTHDLAIGDDAESNTGAKSEHDEVLGSASRADPLLSKDSGVRVIAKANLRS